VRAEVELAEAVDLAVGVDDDDLGVAGVVGALGAL